MSIITLGLNHKTAPVDIRERLAFSPESLAPAVKALSTLGNIKEAAILSTCNRTELYCATENDDELNQQAIEQIVEWLGQFHGLDRTDFNEHLYTHKHIDSIRHALKVACGLDSLVLGEPQILGQMKQAYAQANEQGTMGSLLGKLFQHAFSVAKQVRTDTAIGSSPVSVAFAAVSLSKQIFGDLNEHTALMIGAGETIELAARHLTGSNIKHMIIANRSVDKGQALADQFGAEAIALPQIPDYLHKADIVISSTASPLPILGKGAVEKALKKRKHKPMFMCDIAVPRDVEAEVNDLDDVFLYTVDDLHEIIQENIESREEAAEQAREIIENQIEDFLNWERALDSVEVIRDIRESAMSISDEILQKAQAQLAQGKSAEDALAFLARTLTNKLLHQPSATLRQTGENSRHDLLDFARQLFLNTDTNKKNKPPKKPK
ncbi:MAG: glutamyl-tRNA reductase [endosymbiont of Galathealinum brachiosum]|uniref:Glutamyl-tRNA reductase n=1 Tax=endosymbiont of Galathealinum brachiosum TaxID=2200906 RepID=A0A370DA32_9GAMM|nr:MAG: glutamyl-tRNA reductase [endosymbiont of Galathealinum brachiosum]